MPPPSFSLDPHLPKKVPRKIQSDCVCAAKANDRGIFRGTFYRCPKRGRGWVGQGCMRRGGKRWGGQPAEKRKSQLVGKGQDCKGKKKAGPGTANGQAWQRRRKGGPTRERRRPNFGGEGGARQLEGQAKTKAWSRRPGGAPGALGRPGTYRACMSRRGRARWLRPLSVPSRKILSASIPSATP